ncbi:MAG: decaprenyl-phosphate phosphoribosyltransferase [Deltaproteobacteria bacterium HGW-Deltaproteobacteria-4]|nr:MAG: decaprenyl-phosphate phosphoribosyltransferase [Deltaproteobacteria bacterium HGW-Deltaproteobacteria-4]
MKIKALVLLLRPHQWLKNLILFFPPFLGGKLTTIAASGQVLWQAPLAFCLASSAAYIINDLYDVGADRNHPQKCHRSIAAGHVTPTIAVILAFCCLASALAAAFIVGDLFSVLLLIYLGISLCYSAGLKHLPIIDIFCIASGFVIRLFAGGIAFNVVISDWLFLSVFLLALFLSAGKRLGETEELGGGGGDQRKVLKEYPPGALELFMAISASTVLVTYTMYVVSKHRLVYTVPLCCFGLFRYMLNVKRGASGDPTDALLKDPILFVVGFVWVVLVFMTMYV